MISTIYIKWWLICSSFLSGTVYILNARVTTGKKCSSSVSVAHKTVNKIVWMFQYSINKSNKYSHILKQWKPYNLGMSKPCYPINLFLKWIHLFYVQNISLVIQILKWLNFVQLLRKSLSFVPITNLC